MRALLAALRFCRALRIATPDAARGAPNAHLRTARIRAGCIAAIGMMGSLLSVSFAHDDGRFTGSPLKAWFDTLASGKGLCCSFADGVSVQDVDWDTNGPGGTYRVRLNGAWINVPDGAVVTEANKFGPAVVWPYQDNDGVTQIRCFLPGAGA